jgi:hypothetical protein
MAIKRILVADDEERSLIRLCHFDRREKSWLLPALQRQDFSLRSK